MKKYFLLICLFAIGFSSCRKTVETPYDATAQAKADDQAILDYFLLNDISIKDVTKDPSGLYYQIIAPGTGAHPTTASGVTVNYTGYLLDGTQVDSQLSYFFNPLSNLIEGWKIGIPKIGTGGHIKLYVPSGLAYGVKGSGNVPANSPLYFDITLQGFSN